MAVTRSNTPTIQSVCAAHSLGFHFANTIAVGAHFSLLAIGAIIMVSYNSKIISYRYRHVNPGGKVSFQQAT